MRCSRGRVRSAVLAAHDLVQRLVEVVLEESLKAAEHEVAAAVGEDDEAEMERDEVLAERVAFEAGERGDLADDPVRQRVDEPKEVRAWRGEGGILAGARDLAAADDRETRLVRDRSELSAR